MSGSKLPFLPLPPGVTSRYIDCTSSVGLNFHILDSGYPTSPLLLLIHGFPELAFSWRKIMPSLASPSSSSTQGYHVVAVDQRGYGRTTGWDTRDYDSVDLRSFTFLQLVADMVALVRALGHERAKCVVGHDFGAVTAGWCALVRPDVFGGYVGMSHPFKGVPGFALGGREEKKGDVVHDPDALSKLAELNPPRKHYKWDNSSREAAEQWLRPKQGLKEFLRGYMYLKSADWQDNEPTPLRSWTAEELAKMPGYYVMPRDLSMAETVAEAMQDEDAAATKRWMSDEDLEVYVSEWSRAGFQGGLNWYRSATNPSNNREVFAFAGKKIEVPCAFVSGAKDWGNYQEPGALEEFERSCVDFRGRTLIGGAGHWPQQEKPDEVVAALLQFATGLT